MVVGHTIQQQGINSVCDDMVYRVDVGLSKGCGDGTPEALVILNDGEVVERVSENTERAGKAGGGVVAAEQEQQQRQSPAPMAQ